MKPLRCGKNESKFIEQCIKAKDDLDEALDEALNEVLEDEDG